MRDLHRIEVEKGPGVETCSVVLVPLVLSTGNIGEEAMLKLELTKMTIGFTVSWETWSGNNMPELRQIGILTLNFGNEETGDWWQAWYRDSSSELHKLLTWVNLTPAAQSIWDYWRSREVKS